jgi:sugar/nucleoside kinase (ribokinase family)
MIKLDVIGLGSCNIDFIAFVPKIPSAEEKVIAKSLHPVGGGVTSNALVQLSRLGAKTGWFGKIGDDEIGKQLMKLFEEEGVDTSEVIIEKGKRTSYTWIAVNPEGERGIVVFPNVSAELTVEEVISKQKYLTSCTIFHTECLQQPLAPSLKAAEICKGANIKVSFDMDIPCEFAYESGLTNEKELTRMIELTDIFIPCKSGAISLTDERDLRKASVDLLDYGPELVVITLADKGCVLSYKINGNVKTIEVPAFRVDVKDTTGAGDVFHGAFIYGLLRKWDLEKVALFANACAAIKCTRIGPRSSPTFREVEEFLLQRGIKLF